MNKSAILLALLLMVGSNGFTQTVYSFGTPGGYPNPGWTSSSNTTPAHRVLNYQNNLGTVSSNDTPAGNRYVNNQRTSYTSPDINTTCADASSVTVTFTVEFDLETAYDWGYFQYSIDGGSTWINPVPLSGYNNGAGVNLSAFPPLTTWANIGSNRNGWTDYGSFTYNYTIPTSANTRFRFIFASDGSNNYYTITTGPWWFPTTTNYDYFFDIVSFDINCNIVLPVELASFTGYYDQHSNENSLYWQTETEQDNDYFKVQWTSDPDSGSWLDISNVNGADNSDSPSFYEFKHSYYDRNKINYYRLVQVDKNGAQQVYTNYVSIDNRDDKTKHVVKAVNLLGQEVDVNYPGFVIHVYDDGTTRKIYNP